MRQLNKYLRGCLALLFVSAVALPIVRRAPSQSVPPPAASASVSVKIGNVDAPVSYAGPQDEDAGPDQVNAALPPSRQGRGQLVVAVSVNGQAANMAQVAFQ